MKLITVILSMLLTVNLFAGSIESEIIKAKSKPIKRNIVLGLLTAAVGMVAYQNGGRIVTDSKTERLPATEFYLKDGVTGQRTVYVDCTSYTQRKNSESLELAGAVLVGLGFGLVVKSGNDLNKLVWEYKF